MVKPGIGWLCALAACALVLGCSGAAQSQSGAASHPVLGAWARSATEPAARFESELSKAEWLRVLRLASGLSAAEASEINTVAAELYKAEQLERISPPFVQASMACQNAEERVSLPGLAVLWVHAARDPSSPTIREMSDFSYPTPGESRALLAMRFDCPGEGVIRNDVTALARHRITWGDYRRRLSEGMRAAVATAREAARQAAAQTAAQQAAAQQTQQCRRLAGIVMLQTTPIDAAEAQQIQRCPHLAQYVIFRNMIRNTNDALRATEPSTPQSWHCERSFLGGVDCDSQ